MTEDRIITKNTCIQRKFPKNRPLKGFLWFLSQIESQKSYPETQRTIQIAAT
jgi:hypothetical protein